MHTDEEFHYGYCFKENVKGAPAGCTWAGENCAYFGVDLPWLEAACASAVERRPPFYSSNPSPTTPSTSPSISTSTTTSSTPPFRGAGMHTM